MKITLFCCVHYDCTVERIDLKHVGSAQELRCDQKRYEGKTTGFFAAVAVVTSNPTTYGAGRMAKNRSPLVFCCSSQGMPERI